MKCTTGNILFTLLQVSPWFQNELPSSRLNNTPPMGAPNAAGEEKKLKLTITKFQMVYANHLEKSNIGMLLEQIKVMLDLNW